MGKKSEGCGAAHRETVLFRTIVTKTMPPTSELTLHDSWRHGTLARVPCASDADHGGGGGCARMVHVAHGRRRGGARGMPQLDWDEMYLSHCDVSSLGPRITTYRFGALTSVVWHSTGMASNSSGSVSAVRRRGRCDIAFGKRSKMTVRG